MILASMYTFLSGTGSVTSLCSSIYPEFLPENHQSFPAIVLGLISNDEEMLLDGTTSSLSTATITVDCLDKSLSSAAAVASAVESALIGYRGPFGTETVDHLRKESEDLIPLDPSTELIGVSMQFFIGYS